MDALDVCVLVQDVFDKKGKERDTKMGEREFWRENGDYLDSVMNTVNTLAEDTYIYILHLNRGMAWFSETAKAYFGIRDTYVPDHYEIMRRLIHPEDLWEYEEGIPQ